MSKIDWSNAPEGMDYAFTTGPKWSGVPEFYGKIMFAESRDGEGSEIGQLNVDNEFSWVFVEKRPKKLEIEIDATITIFTRLREATKAADELPGIISEINALLPDGWEVRRCVEHVAGGSGPVFKVGQKWKRRDGTIVRIKTVTDDEDYPVICSLGRMYSASGFWMKSEKESDIDLVELIEDAPK